MKVQLHPAKYINQSNSRCLNLIRYTLSHSPQLPNLFFCHSRSVIFHINKYTFSLFLYMTAKLNTPGTAIHTMSDRIFHKWLQNHKRHIQRTALGITVQLISETTAKSKFLNIQIIFNLLQFLMNGHDFSFLIQHTAQITGNCFRNMLCL